MPRPTKPRFVCHSLEAVYFKPRGVPMYDLEEVVLGLDETEALRLADLEGLSHEQAGERLQVSRPTVGRILESARRKVAEALVHGKALRIRGGVTQQSPAEDPGRRGPHPGFKRRRSQR